MPFLIVIAVCLVIFLIVYFSTPNYKNPEFIGKQGEKAVNSIIGKTKPNKKYIINNLILEDEGKTSQIDHIVINPRGIFVIETKNYAGNIYGSENQLEWTQVLAYGRVKNKLYNPLKQNATHVYNVKKIVGKLPVYSLVVFVRGEIAYSDSVSDFQKVIPLRLLKKTLKTGENVLSFEQMEKAYNSLLSKKSNISTKEHIENVKRQQSALENGFCPRCGGTLVLRKGKYGDFWGCSNYPDCKFIKK